MGGSFGERVGSASLFDSLSLIPCPLGSCPFDSSLLGFSALSSSGDFPRDTDFGRGTENEEPPMPIKGRVS